MKRILSLVLCILVLLSTLPMGMSVVADATPSATIDFTNSDNRVSYTTEQQVWTQNGITVTNDRAASTSNVANYSNPARFYKSSAVTIAYPGMTKIVIESVVYNDKDYSAPWANSFTDANATATAEAGVVTIVLTTPVDSFKWEMLSAQARAYSITVYADDVQTPVDICDPLDNWDVVSEYVGLELYNNHPEMNQSVAMRTPASLTDGIESYLIYKNESKVATAIEVGSIVMDGWAFDLAVYGRNEDDAWTSLEYTTTDRIDIGCPNRAFKQSIATVIIPAGYTEIKMAMTNVVTWTFFLNYVNITWETEFKAPVEPEDPTPPADSTLTIAEAIALATAQEHNVYTVDKYYVTGTIKEVYNIQYGNMRITDDVGNVLTIYGSYNADGTVRYDGMDVQPVAGDTITVYGIIGHYNGTPQVKNGWIVSHTGTAEPEFPEEPVEPEDSTWIVADTLKEGVTYKLALYQSVQETTYYFTGMMRGYYGDTEADISISADMYVEIVDDGYQLFFNNDTGLKQYIKLEQSGNYYNFTFGEEGSVFTLDAERNALYTQAGDQLCYMGTYGSYSTMGALTASKMSDTDHIARLYVETESTGSDEPVEPEEPEDSPLGVVANPKTGVAYKFGMVQKNVSTDAVYFLTGAMSGYYMATTTNYDNAIDVYLEEVSGGYHLYGMVAGDKTYINMVISGTHVNPSYETTASTVYTYDATAQTLIADIEGIDYWFGTRNDKSYTTVGPVKVEFEGFYCQLYSNTPHVPEIPVEPEEPDFAEIVEAAYALANGTSLPGTYTLTGTVTSICTDYDAAGDYITVMLTVPGCVGKAIMCYQLTGAGVSTLSIGDTATVTGTLQRYNNHVEFSAGCTLDDYVKAAPTEPVEPPTDAGTILADAYALPNGMAVPYIATLTGTVTSIDEGYSAEYNTITVTIAVKGYEHMPVRCYRIIGENAAKLKVGDVIVVTGRLQNFFDVIEFAFHSTFTMAPIETTPIPVANEIGLAQGVNSYTQEKYYVTGKVVAISNNIYGNLYIADEYDNVLYIYGMYNEDGTVRFDSLDRQPAIGDTITVYGILGTYAGHEAQMKNGWLVNLIPGESEEVDDPAANSVLTVSEAIDLGLSKLHNVFTDNKYYVTGKITEIYNDIYGNMRITDADGNVLTIYGSYNTDGSVRFDGMDEKPHVGDIITVYGIIGQYNQTPQIKNAWIIDWIATESVNPITFQMDSVTALAGDTVTVALRTENNPGIVSLRLQVLYDASVLTPIAMDGLDFSDIHFGPIDGNPLSIMWVDALHPDVTTDGVVAFITFRIAEDAPAGVLPLILQCPDPTDVFNYDMQMVPFDTIDGSITVMETMIGDLDGNRRLNMRDVALLQRYLNGWDVTIHLPTADCNNDGKVNIRDLSWLVRYLNGWDV